MTVVDVNTGKFVGSGGNPEQTVTRNNMEAAEEIVRQLRLRDIGGIIVIDYIDMVLESNRDLVLRRLTECLGRDRTKHQVAEVTSLGLVQMTRKRVGQGLLEVFSEPCEHCRGRGIIVSTDPVDEKRRGGGNSGGGNSGGGNSGGGNSGGNGRRDRSGGSRDTAKDVESAPAVEEPAAEGGGEGGGEAEPAEGGRSGGRRNRGRRGRGQAGEDRAAEDAAVLTAVETADDAAEAPAPSEEPVAEQPPAEEPTESEGIGIDGIPREESVPVSPAVTSVEPVVASDEVPATGRPRRRRAASRPAGPPVA
jgi:ribonuclease E